MIIVLVFTFVGCKKKVIKNDLAETYDRIIEIQKFGDKLLQNHNDWTGESVVRLPSVCEHKWKSLGITEDGLYEYRQCKKCEFVQKIQIK